MESRGQSSLRIATALIVGLIVAGAPATYLYLQNTSLTSQINSLNGQLSQSQNNASTLNSRLASNVSEVASLQTQITALQRELASNQSDVAALQSKVNSLQGQLDILNTQTANLQSQITKQNAILALSQNTVWWYRDNNSCSGGGFVVQCGAFYGPFVTQYAGYVVVFVQMPSPSNDYVAVTWSAFGVNYNTTQDISHTADVAFAVLPASNLMITVAYYGNATVTITYYY